MSAQGEKNLSPTMGAGSEEDFHIVCDWCLTEGRRVEAVQYCVDCAENLCDGCITAHKKIPAFMGHVIQGKSSLQTGQTVNKTNEARDPLIDRCPKHPEEVIKFYCNNHNTLGCGVCIPLHHRNCEDISYIRDVSGGIAKSDEMKKLQADLKRIGAKLAFCKSQSKWVHSVIKESTSEVVSEIKRFRLEINELLDKLERDFLETVFLLKEEAEKVCEQSITTCDEQNGEKDRLIADIKGKLDIGHNNRLYISMKRASGTLSEMESEARRLSNEHTSKRFKFQRDEKLCDLLSTLTSLGTLTLSSPPADVQARYLHDIYVKADTDTKDCYITDAAVLPDGRLALTDSDNKSVRLVDVGKNEMLEHITLPSNPLSMTAIKDNNIAVKIKGVRSLQILSVSPTLSLSHTIPVPGLYQGVAYCEDQLIMTCVNPVKAIHICDMSGNLLRQIETDRDGSKLFTFPWFVCVIPDHRLVYVGDRDRNAVVCMNMEGDVINTYKNAELQSPRGITTDNDGNAYVCSYNNHTVHQLTATGQLVKILQREKDGIVFPWAIAHSGGKLYISSGSTAPAQCNNIKVFRLE